MLDREYGVFSLNQIIENWELTIDEQNELKDLLITRDGTLRDGTAYSQADVLDLMVVIRSRGLRITVFEPASGR